MKKTRIILTEEAEMQFNKLKRSSEERKIERTIFNSFLQKVEMLKVKPHYGQPISKKLFPEKYKKSYSISNLFRLELPSYWRILYTITNDTTNDIIIILILSIINHDTYNKLFGYKKL